MTTSSATRTADVNEWQEPVGNVGNDVLSSTSSTAARFALPRFDVATGINARIAARRNAATISPKERQALLNERQSLLQKTLAKTITREEENRLEYVRWSLDRIEDALYGHELDALESYVARYEQFEEQVRTLQRELHQVSRRRR